MYNFIVWKYIASMGPVASEKLYNLKFQFLALENGWKKPPDVWKKCVVRTFSILTFAVGRLYIDHTFSTTAKSTIDHLVEAVNVTMGDVIMKMKWLDAKTKHEAMRKLRKMIAKVGYPEWMRNDSYLNELYSQVPIITEKSSFVRLFYDVSRLDSIYSLQSLREAYNSTEAWGSGPADVNAYYSPNDNDISFPAGILQPPFFQHGMPPYINMGAIGTIIGHELAHAFDDFGSQYDADGVLRDWWTPETRKKFLERAQCFVEQYGNVTVDNGTLRLNGVNTQGENIADNLGLKAAYMAFERSDMNNIKLPGLEGFTPEQLFFIANAMVWCSTSTSSGLRYRVLYGQHSPTRYRVNVPMSNLMEFSEAFGCKTTSPMYAKKRCTM
ncbi:unnamed protein product [Ixodes hexagonus]